jgi:hypothetical protein
MKLYADPGPLRTRQLVRDLGVLAWCLVWIGLGRRATHLVDRLGGVGRSVEGAGGRFASTLDDVSGTIGRLPLVGDDLDGPFAGASGAGRALQHAGAAQADAVHTLALWIGVLVALVPIALVLWRVVPGRLAWAREATAAAALRLGADDLHLFALRAVVNRPLHQLQRVSNDPMADLAAGRHHALAGLELAALGLAVPDPGPDPAGQVPYGKPRSGDVTSGR